MNEFKDLFLLDPSIHFLNHGSYGATPKPVFEVYQAWQRKLETQPVKFLGREIKGYLQEARVSLADFLGAGAADLVYIPNATFGVNVVARSLNLNEGDEVLSSDHEYGACDKTWAFLAKQKGFSYVKQAISLDLASEDDLVNAFWQGVTERTKVIFLSHISSPTAVVFPIEAICKKAREAGIITVIDGAHAPGQLELNLSTLGADFYTGNCHKWMCSPKGAGFLYASKEMQPMIEPLVVSWGYESSPENSVGSPFLDMFDWLGTNDPAAYLTVPSAIAFQKENDWPEVRETCNKILKEALESLEAITTLSMPPLFELTPFVQLVAAPLPKLANPDAFKDTLYDSFSVELPMTKYYEQDFVRISVQAYNSQEDLDALLNALTKLLK